MANKKKDENSSTQIERVRWLHGQVLAGEYPSAQDMADHFDISLSTAYRDIEYLKDTLGAPLVYDYKIKGFTYGSTFSLPLVKLKEGELVSILVMEQMRKMYEGTNLEKPIMSAFEKVAEGLQDPVSVDLRSLDNILQFNIEPFPSVDLNLFDALVDFIRHRITVVLKYFSGQKAYIADKKVDPYHLICYKDNWYLISWCHEKQDLRDFLVSRILAVEPTNATFEYHPDYDLETHKRESLLFRGSERSIRIRCEFDKFAAHWIRLKKVHPTQQIFEREDGSIEVTFLVTSYENMLRWVLSFGEHARVLEPIDLIYKVKRSVDRLAQLYAHVPGYYDQMGGPPSRQRYQQRGYEIGRPPAGRVREYLPPRGRGGYEIGRGGYEVPARGYDPAARGYDPGARGGYERPGYERPGYERPGYERGGYERGGYERGGGYEQPPRGGYEIDRGRPGTGFGRGGFEYDYGGGYEPDRAGEPEPRANAPEEETENDE
ncbi:MAG: WYL domain-containing transcriptional regulator [bacterium]|jgi:predicted DNA-binding transcriptional regulator YafY